MTAIIMNTDMESKKLSPAVQAYSSKTKANYTIGFIKKKRLSDLKA